MLSTLVQTIHKLEADLSSVERCAEQQFAEGQKVAAQHSAVGALTGRALQLKTDLSESSALAASYCARLDQAKAELEAQKQVADCEASINCR